MIVIGLCFTWQCSSVDMETVDDVVRRQFYEYPNAFIKMTYIKILKINKCVYPFAPGRNNNNIQANQAAMEMTDPLQFLTHCSIFSCS